MSLKNSLIIILILFTQYSFSQSWEKVINVNGDDIGNSAILINDKIYIGSINTNSSSIVVLDEKGDVVKSHSLNHYYLISTLIKTPENDIIVIGNTGSSSSANILVSKLDTNMNTIWTYRHVMSNFSFAESGIINSNGDITVCGYRSNSLSDMSGRDGLIIRINSSGNHVWGKQISNNNSDYFSGIVELNTGELVATGAMVGSHGLMDIYLCKISSTGNVISGKTFGGSANDGGYTLLNVGNSIYVTANSWSVGAGAQDIILMKFNYSLDLLLMKSIGSTGIEPGLSILSNNHNSFYLSGITNSVSGNLYDLYLLEIDSLGNIIKQFNIGRSNSTEANGYGYKNIIKQNDHFIMVAGSNNLSSTRDLYATKFSLNSNNCCGNVNPINFNSQNAALNTSSILFNNINQNTSNTISPNTTILNTTTSNLCANVQLINNISANTNTICVNTTAYFNANTNDVNTNYFWDFGDLASGINNYSSMQNTNHQYTQAGSYLITCISNNTCTSDTDSIYINVIQEPLLVTNILNTNASYCMGDSIQFKFSTNDTLTNFVWRFDNSTFSNLDSPTHVYTSAGLYNVQLITSNKCFSDTDYVAITIKNSTALNSRITSGNNVQICLGSSFNFIANSDDVNARYHWDFGVNLLNSDTSILRTPSYNYPIAGNYRVRLIVQNDCGIDTLYVDVEVIQSVPFNNNIILNNTTFCKNSSYVFDASYLSNQHVYEWDFGDPASGLNNYSNAMSASHTFSNAGSYLIKCIVSDACKTDTDTIRINVIESIELNTQILNQNMVFCQKETVSFQANSDDPNANYFWNFGDPNSTENTSNTQNASHQFSQTGTYTVRLISTNTCLNDTSSVVINIRENPLPDFEFNIDTCASILNLINTSVDISQNNYEWIINDEIISQSNINYILENNNDYEIKLLVNKNTECSDSLVSIINYVVDDSNELLTIPDAFSPNGDNQNDVFIIRASSKCKLEELKIYDRWGNIIYKQYDEDKFYWDGKINNTTQADGVYIVHLKYNGKQYIRTLSLIK